MQYTNRTERLGGAGLIQSISQGAHTFLYRVSTVKDPKWNIGDEVEIGGGRKAVYALSTGATALYASRGCSFSNSGYTAYTSFAVSGAVGDTELTVPAATHAALTKDELAGGFIVIFDGVSDYYTTTRMIVGNGAAEANAAFKVQLDAEITYAVTSGTSACEVYESPYSAMVESLLRDQVKAGVPLAYVPASASYFWILKEGILWVTPQGNLGNTGGKASGWWHDFGNVSDIVTALGVSIGAANSSQYAGHVVTGSIGGNGPLFMLKG
jgi:hypothetical protein